MITTHDADRLRNPAQTPARRKLPLYRNMAFQMLLALVAGGLIGVIYPEIASQLSPLSAAFMKMIKALVGLVIFLTIVQGIANIGKGSNVGRLGLRAIIYFEVLTTLAMIVGLVVSKVFTPGAGMNIDYHSLNASAISSFVSTAEHRTTVSWLLSIIPDTFVSAFTNGNLLPILLMAVMFGVALLRMGERAAMVVDLMDKVSEAVFGMVGMVMKLAPLAVFGAIGYTIGNYGLSSMVPLAKFLLLFYLCCVMFVIVVLGAVCLYTRVSLWQLIKYLRVEILLAFGTASSEAVLPNIMKKLVDAGVKKHVAGFVIPAGFSFNLDGSSMYFVMAIMFVAQACNVPLTLTQELSMILIFMVTSKGIAGVAGAGFVTLAATLQMFPEVPLAGIVLLLGIDRFMDAMRTVTNIIGNAVATLTLAKMEKALDYSALNKAFGSQSGN
ncbi:C4-dicarboxylate transporter DctA [Pseudomonas sp. R5(2019)]|uniref:C4-dicarboxylate transporter DctA n=1 Tax=Pseudomonas sp. R5(2019) TaxID=2697566 RepID=UPI001411FFB5|nr:C4-dicarboxylate transporter DctA [Pseudomonas sp. R5(2019)]NBA96558.1 C4-dicarboxylate transporter DctA [Pseudomonas sp. R5(2019)]